MFFEYIFASWYCCSVLKRAFSLPFLFFPFPSFPSCCSVCSIPFSCFLFHLLQSVGVRGFLSVHRICSAFPIQCVGIAFPTWYYVVFWPLEHFAMSPLSRSLSSQSWHWPLLVYYTDTGLAGCLTCGKNILVKNKHLAPHTPCSLCHPWYKIQGASLRGRHTPPATLAQEGKIAWSGQGAMIDCKWKLATWKCQETHNHNSRKTTQTPHAWVRGIYRAYMHLVLCCICDVYIRLSRSLWLQSFCR